MGTDEAMESELGLGELAGLTVANEADSLAYDVSRKRQNGTISLWGNYFCSCSCEKHPSIPPSSFKESHHMLMSCHLCVKQLFLWATSGKLL